MVVDQPTCPSIQWRQGVHWRIWWWGLGRDARPLDPISFIFMQFSGKTWPNNRLASPPWRLAPSSGKSWIRHNILLFPIQHWQQTRCAILSGDKQYTVLMDMAPQSVELCPKITQFNYFVRKCSATVIE